MIFNINVRKLPSKYGEVSVMTRQSIHISKSIPNLKKIGFSHENGLIETGPFSTVNGFP